MFQEAVDSKPDKLICNIDDAFKYVLEEHKILPLKEFEDMIANLQCPKYKRAPRYFVINTGVPKKNKQKENAKSNLKWDWIRNKRSLLNPSKNRKDRHTIRYDTSKTYDRITLRNNVMANIHSYKHNPNFETVYSKIDDIIKSSLFAKIFNDSSAQKGENKNENAVLSSDNIIFGRRDINKATTESIRSDKNAEVNNLHAIILSHEKLTTVTKNDMFEKRDINKSSTEVRTPHKNEEEFDTEINDMPILVINDDSFGVEDKEYFEEFDKDEFGIYRIRKKRNKRAPKGIQELAAILKDLPFASMPVSFKTL